MAIVPSCLMSAAKTDREETSAAEAEDGDAVEADEATETEHRANLRRQGQRTESKIQRPLNHPHSPAVTASLGIA